MLKRFRVVNFRSIQDSTWIEVHDNTCLVGVNESGKTNLLLALWKMNPANDEPIVPLIDYPRKKFVDYEETSGNEIFITADFIFAETQVEPLTKMLSCGVEELTAITISRKYSGNYSIKFPNSKEALEITDEVFDEVFKLIPKFVYYSDYGNLDAEIYLPHVIQNLERTDLGEKERAKVRSLKVLFDFVKLKPNEILELGQEQRFNAHQQNPTNQQVELERENKKRREILLQSASNKLTQDFKEWWKQGNYRFRFQADGNHFRIWVSDELRQEEVELEGRSRGLQWFFSFFLVFLVESKNTHANCILLLDEPGISLHPLAQIDLIKFFTSLSQNNQLIYTTHSPFLVSSENLANVKAVFIDDKGLSSVSSDLRKNEKIAEKSIYPIHAAIGLTISDTLLLGCQVVLVEGTSDQIYFQIIKNYLLSKGKYRNNKEMVFIPTGGVRGMSTVINILTGRENQLPFVILDADKPAKEKEKNLKKDLYRDDQDRIISVGNILDTGQECEVEDLFPIEELAKVFSKRYRGKETEDFEYLVNNEKPIITQMENFARHNNYNLELGWKVELAGDFQKNFGRISDKITKEIENYWESLFEKLTS